MNTRDFLQRHLETLNTLAAPGAIQRGVDGDDEDALEDELTRQWETEARLIRRVLAEDAAPPETLATWRERTEAFKEDNPDRAGWTDKQGNEWRVDLVLEAIDNVLDHIDNWSTNMDAYDEDES